MISFEEFLKDAMEPERHLRFGQKLMTKLAAARPDLYDRIRFDDPVGIPGSGAGHDCYYNDSKAWGTIRWIRENW